VTSIGQWWAAGEQVVLPGRGAERAIFVRRMGAGPPMTLLHGLPSCSHEWDKITPALAERHTLLLPDLLGFGASDKPLDHDYTLIEQADLVEALWAHEGITSTIVVAHDYSVSVMQELFARRAEGSLVVDIAAVHLLNGGLYPDLHRAQPIQVALLDLEQGPKISASLNGDLMTAALKPTFSEDFNAAADSADIWAATSRDDGQLLFHRLMQYIPERRANAERWTTALETTDVLVSFIWGMLDPISGGHMAPRIREGRPHAPFLALDDVSHWPMLEAPERVSAAVLAG
jgi:pimeloyl-ACP methyl ester carboxylesterase